MRGDLAGVDGVSTVQRRKARGRVWRAICSLALLGGIAAAIAEASTQPADLTVSVNSSGAAIAGQTAKFMVAVSNAGGETASSEVTVSFSPSGANGGGLSATGEGWTCSSSSCTASSDVQPGATLPVIEVEVPVTAERTTNYFSDGRIVLAASVESSDEETTANNTADAAAGIWAAGRADAALTLRPPATPPARGESADFEAVVSNIGGAAIGSRIELAFDISLAGQGPGWTCPADAGRCVTDADLAAGATLPELTLSSQTSASSTAVTRSVYAQVETDDDFIHSNDTGSAQTPLVPARGPDLTLTLRPGPVAPQGSTATALVTVANVGPAPSNGDIEVAFDSDTSASGAGWTCPAGAERCVTSATVAPGETLPELDLQMPTDSSSSGAWFWVQLSGGGDGLVQNNFGWTMVPLARDTAPVDVLARLRPHYDPATRVVSWTAKVGNAGTTGASAVTLVEFERPYAAGVFGSSRTLTDFTISGEDWICANRYCLHEDPIAAGGELPDLVLSAPLPPSMGVSEVSTSLTVFSPDDEYADNDSASATIATGAIGADLATMVRADSSVRVGESGSASVKVTNLGNEAVTGPVQVTLSSTTHGAAASGAGWLCGADLVCTHPGPVAVGGSLPALNVVGPSTNREVGTQFFDARVAHNADEVPDDDRGTSSYSVGGVAADLIPVLDVAGPWASGEIGRASATVANAGPNEHAGPVTLQLGAPWDAVPRGDDWACTTSLACTYAGTIAPGATAPPLELLAPVPASVGPTTSRLTAGLVGADDDFPFNDSISARVAVVATNSPGGLQPRFSRDRSGNVVPDQPEQVVLHVRNGASTDAAGPFSVRVTPSRAITVEAIAGTGWTCDETLLCQRTLSIPAGETTSLEMSVRASSTTTDLESLVASVRQGSAPPTSALLALPLSTVSGIDLLQHVEAIDATTAGSPAQFRVNVRNGGSVVARKRVHVRLSTSGRDDGPISASGAGWTCPAGTQRCLTDADVPPGGALPDLVVLAPSAAGSPGGSLRLRSDLEGVGNDAYPANDAGQARSPIVAASGVDLVPSVAIDADLEAGQSADATISVHNVGSSAAGPVTLYYSVSGSVADSPEASGSGWLCSAYRCLHAGPVEAGAALPPIAVSTKTRRERSSSSSYGRVTVSATVESGEDAVDGNDSASARAPLFSHSGVDLVYGLRPSGPLLVGSSPEYLGLVRNVGGESATERIEVTTPSDWLASGSGWSCPAGSGRCLTDADLAPGEQLPEISLTDPSTVAAPSQWSAWGTVLSSEDGEPDNNEGSATVSAHPAVAPDLAATIEPPEAADAGEPAQFEAIIRNPGSAATSGPVGVDLSPEGVTASGSEWSCVEASCTTSATVAPNGALPPLTISRPTSADDGSTGITLTVETEGDFQKRNNEASASVGLRGSGEGADLRLHGALSSEARQGGAATWALVAANEGDAASGEVTVSIDRPYLRTYLRSRSLAVSASGVGWSCGGSGSATCTHSSLAAGEAAARIEVEYEIPVADALGTIDLNAWVDAAEQAPDAGGNDWIALRYGVGGVLRDLVASISSPPGVQVDEALGQIAEVRNVGSEPIAGPVELAVDPPSGDAVVSGTGWTCDSPYRCTHPGPVAAGGALPDVSIESPAPLSSYARTATTSVEVNADNDEATDDDRAATSAGRGIAEIDLGPEITPGPPVHHGELAAYDVVVRNGGTVASDEDWTLKLSAPSGTTAGGGGWVCTSDLSCTIGAAVPPGAATPALHVSTPAVFHDGSADLNLTATIGESDDQFSSNDSALGRVGGGGPAVDVVPLVRPLGRWRAGSTATFRAEIANHGAAEAAGEVNVTLDAPYDGAQATGEGWVCTSNLHCVHGGPIAPGATLAPLNVSVPVPESAGPRTLSAGVSVEVPSDQVESNNSTDLLTGIEHQLEVRRAALFDGEAQRSRLPRGGSTPVQVRLAEGIDPQEATLTAILPAGLSLDGDAGPGLANPISAPVTEGKTRIVWDVVPGQPDSARTFTISAAPSAAGGLATIQLELASELTAAPELDDAPLTIAEPGLGAPAQAVVARAADQAISASGYDIDPSHRLVLRRGGTSAVGYSTTSSPTSISALFDLEGIEPGPATLVLKAADSSELATSSTPVTVAAPEYRDPQVTVTVASRLRINTESFAFVSVFNPSNVDIRMVPLIVSAPPGVELRPDGSGGREILAAAYDKLATDDTPEQYRLSEVERGELVGQLEEAPPVEEDPETGGERTAVVMPRIPAGGTARLRVGLIPRAMITAPLGAVVPIERDLFAETGYVTDFVGRILAQAPQSSGLSAASAQAVTAAAGSDIDCSGENADWCKMYNLYATGLDEAKQQAQGHACVSFTGVTGGVVGSDCQVDPTGPATRAVRKKFPLLDWLESIVNAFDLYGSLSDSADRIEAAAEPTQFGVQSVDPNDKLGPRGYGAEHWITGEDPLTYSIRFENLRTASAAAQQVQLTDTLPAELDPSTVQLLGAEVGGTPIPMTTSSTANARSATGSALLDSSSDRDVLLDVGVDVPSGLMEATFRGSPRLDDPLTPTAFGDFLPPNDDDRRGEGSLTLAARAKQGLPTGTEIANVATIIFDPHGGGPAIETPVASNRLDRSAPTVDPPHGSVYVGEPLRFDAADDGSGLAGTVVTPTRDGVALTPIELGPGARQFSAPDTPGTYVFDLRVSDHVGRTADARSDPIVVAAAPVDSGSGSGTPDSSPSHGEPSTETAPSVATAPVPSPRIVVPRKLRRADLARGVRIGFANLLPRSRLIVRAWLGSRPIARLKRRVRPNGRLRVKLRLDRRGLTRLKRSSRLTIVCRARALDGSVRTLRRRIGLRRGRSNRLRRRHPDRGARNSDRIADARPRVRGEPRALP
jgi:hypothetical protein